MNVRQALELSNWMNANKESIFIQYCESIILKDYITRGNVGIALAFNEKTKRQTAYMSSLPSRQEFEAKWVCEMGSPLYVEEAVAFFGDLVEVENYIMSRDGLQDWFEDEHK
jgi:hypothetical protein